MNRFNKFIFVLLVCPFLQRAQAPTATIITPAATLCTGQAYTFSSVCSSSNVTYAWSIVPGLSVTSNPNSSNGTNMVTFGRSGFYSMSLTVTDVNGSNTAVASVSVTQNALASFNASLDVTGYPSQMNLTNYSSGHTSSQWFYSDAPSDNTPNTVKNYTTSGNYTITLIAYGNNACNDTSVYRFRIADSSGITMPNIFTPNNDSINDIFKPIARGIVKMNAYVYDRFGTIMHQWDKPQGYWDGRNTSGDPLSPGVYFYVLEATGFDGKTYKLKGNVTLLR